ncbi:MAG: HNH endonuclease domain-containing protein [Longimicrobiales bacterium]
MTDAVPTAEAQLAFIQKVRRLLDEGMFVATYKYALLHAIADLCVTQGDDTGAPLTLSTRDLADQFVRLYWRQAAPFPAGDVDAPLRQNTGRQAAVVNVVREARAEYDARLGRLESSDAWRGVLGRVERTVRRMPLWKLQTVGTERLEFLYEHQEEENPPEIVLKPGVAYCFRQFYSLITEMVQGAWTQHVRRTNDARLGAEAELRHFLFGTQRRDLSRVREILEDVQDGECFYCRGRLRSSVAVDHFVPWSRYPLDLGHNFVLAHNGCNGAKGDRLAAVPHLERWVERTNDTQLYELDRRFEHAGLVHDRRASLRITRWAYEQVARHGGQVWVRDNELVRLGGDWETVLAG